ncbi:MAG: exodeoxyribonuclease VII small subunit [Bacillota bacterium]|nr:exodeoxyribonuclease VII small subunit [Bacillota bacterium]MDI9415744.1 exodeoxyribonuclease VII small subunit [Bacillota bacterium]HOB88396.1 exodeoxyribonuclease VII small subunit [Bacillota bacterium]HOJ57582.1 exodeoxyribonuclease VII small subunit [Bacillota bacterium]HOL01957.1 exodeoxyribonuclease VII small subunit [Bacillota bacterium]
MDKGKDEISFEEAMKQLEETVNALESGTLGLEESLEAFEKGMSLVRICQAKLEEAETKITQLIETKEGKLITESFRIGDE